MAFVLTDFLIEDFVESHFVLSLKVLVHCTSYAAMKREFDFGQKKGQSRSFQNIFNVPIALINEIIAAHTEKKRNIMWLTKKRDQKCKQKI